MIEEEDKESIKRNVRHSKSLVDDELVQEVVDPMAIEIPKGFNYGLGNMTDSTHSPIQSHSGSSLRMSMGSSFRSSKIYGLRAKEPDTLSDNTDVTVGLNMIEQKEQLKKEVEEDE
jgi:hypothetical protein